MRRPLGMLFVAISAASFAAMPVFARLAYDAGVDPVTALFLRFGIGSALMLLLLGARREPVPRGRTLLALTAMGLVGYLGVSLCYFTALTLASAGLVSLLLYLYPALVTVLSAALFRERVGWTRAAALLLALAGAGLTIGLGGGGRPLGIALAVAAAVLYACYIVAGGRVMRRVRAVPATAVITAATALAYTGLIAVRGAHLPATALGWAACLALAAVCTVLAFVTFLAGLERIGATDAATISTLEPLLTVTLAALALGERPTPSMVAGGALILAAVVLLARAQMAPADAAVRRERAGGAVTTSRPREQ